MKKIIIILIALFLSVFSVNAGSITIYAEIIDTSPAPSKMNIGDIFKLDIKFNAADTFVYSLTTLMRWDASAVKYISKTDNLLWECSSAVDNINLTGLDHNPDFGIFFWDYAGLDTGYTGVNAAHTLTFQILQKKNFIFEVILGNVISGGFSGSGLTTLSSEPGIFFAITSDSGLSVDTYIIFDTTIIWMNSLDNVVIIQMAIKLQVFV